MNVTQYKLLPAVVSPGPLFSERTHRWFRYWLAGVSLASCFVLFQTSAVASDEFVATQCLAVGRLERGEGAIRAAGFFGNDWSIQNGEFVWHDQ